MRTSLLVAVILTAMTPLAGAAPVSAATVTSTVTSGATATSGATITSRATTSTPSATAQSLLSRLAVRPEAGNTTYVRTYFKLWIDANGDCQNTRAEVLIAESRATPTYTTSRRCAVATGKWYSYYDGVTWTDPADVDIDHLVPLKEAWGSGAELWPAGDRTRYANDLGLTTTLVAVTDHVNQAKGDKDPAQWLPSRTPAWCTYATSWVQVKYRWRLSIDSAERTRLSSILSGSCGSRATKVPARAI